LVFLTLNANASLNDDFVFSSKLGLTTESVTTSWTKAENGLSFGGDLNGVPRDTWHDLYYLDNKLALVVIGYHPENDKFETGKASRQWSIDAANNLIKHASRKYGEPEVNTLTCENQQDFFGCKGNVVWKGSRKVFSIKIEEVELPKIRSLELGFSTIIQMTLAYTKAEHFGFLQARLPYLINDRNDRIVRRLTSYYKKYVFSYLRQENMTFEELLNDQQEKLDKILNIKRDSSATFVRGVKPGYEAERWAKSFRLQ
jgi:hypothetical protein